MVAVVVVMGVVMGVCWVCSVVVAVGGRGRGAGGGGGEGCDLVCWLCCVVITCLKLVGSDNLQYRFYSRTLALDLYRLSYESTYMALTNIHYGTTLVNVM